MTTYTPPATLEGGKAQRVYMSLRDRISNGTLAVGSLLPAENRLAEMFQVSRITVRRALDALAADGLIEKRAGAGSRVVTTPSAGEEITADFANLMPQIVTIGRMTTIRLLSFSYGPAPVRAARALGLDDGEVVQTAVRLRLRDDKAFSHLTTYVPQEFSRHYDARDLASTNLYELLERGGVTVAAADQSVTATLAAPEVADALGISVGAALLSVERVMRDQSGRAVEYLSALYRPDLFRLEMSLARVDAGEGAHWRPVIGGDGEGNGDAKADEQDEETG